MLARLALVAASVLVLAWTAVLLRDHHVGQAALHDLRHQRELPPARFARDVRRLEDAELLNPDLTWERHQGGAWLVRRRPRKAIEVLDALVRREPENYQAWAVLYSAAHEVDPRRANQALAQLERLTPLGRP